MINDFVVNDSDVSFLFVGYCDRSGSTFLLNELSKYSRVIVCPEADVLVRLLLKEPNKAVSSLFLNKIRVVCKTDPKLRLWNILPEEQHYANRLNLFYSILLQFALKENEDVSLIVFKERSILSYYELLDSYPKNKFYLSIIRDPRAVFASQRNAFKSFKKNPLNTNPFTVAKQWNAFNNKLVSLRKREKDYMEIRYENMIANCNLIIGSIMSFLGKHRIRDDSANNQSTSFLFSLKDVKKHQLIGQSPLLERIHAWKDELSDNEISVIELMTKEWMQFFGYSSHLLSDKKRFTKYYARQRVCHLFSSLRWWIIVLYRKIIFIGLTNNQ